MTDEKQKSDPNSTDLPHTIKLRFPFDPGDGLVKKEIVFKRFPKAMLSLPLMASDITHGHYVPTLCEMTDEPELTFRRMCHGDYRAMVDFAANFF